MAPRFVQKVRTRHLAPSSIARSRRSCACVRAWRWRQRAGCGRRRLLTVPLSVSRTGRQMCRSRSTMRAAPRWWTSARSSRRCGPGCARRRPRRTGCARAAWQAAPFLYLRPWRHAQALMPDEREIRSSAVQLSHATPAVRVSAPAAGPGVLPGPRPEHSPGLRGWCAAELRAPRPGMCLRGAGRRSSVAAFVSLTHRRPRPHARARRGAVGPVGPHVLHLRAAPGQRARPGHRGAGDAGRAEDPERAPGGLSGRSTAERRGAG